MENEAERALKGTDEECKAACGVALEYLAKQKKQPAALMRWLLDAVQEDKS